MTDKEIQQILTFKQMFDIFAKLKKINWLSKQLEINFLLVDLSMNQLALQLFAHKGGGI